MCGIAGWAGDRGPDRATLSNMVEAIRHRGPDESGFWESPDASLGMSRLSIIDVAEGHQPVFAAGGTVVAVCNGEIYNYAALAADLRSQGVSLASSSDVEVIPHLYEIHGEGFVRLLRGMFAIALFDARSSTLILVRDRVGKKPLHYFEAEGSLAFGSEVRALLAGGLDRQPDLNSIDHVLAFGNVPLEGGAFAGVKQVPAGHVLRFQAGQASTRPYWTWHVEPSFDSVAEAKIAVRDALDEAVRLRLVSERPLGSFLSGGVDSTIVTAMMARHHTGPVKTFTIGLGDRVHDEAPFAREVARHLGTDHHELVLEPDPVTIMEALSTAFDEPFADSSAVPTLLLSKFAAENVVVALAGDGGDEAFGGYVRYRAAWRLQQLNSVLSVVQLGKPLMMSAASTLHKPRLARLANALAPQPSLQDRYLRIMSLTEQPLRRTLWSDDALAAVDPSQADFLFGRVWARSAGQHAINRMRMHDLASYLPGDLLVKVDIASMAHSLEVRSPFLDQEVLQVAGRLPTSMMIRGRVEKWLLRQIAYDLVPRALIDRPKQGFSIPRASWLRGPLRDMTHDLLLDRTARERGWFRPQVVQRLLDEHDGGLDRDMQLWPLLVIEAWARRWVDESN